MTAVDPSAVELAARHEADYRRIFEAATDGFVVNDPETGRVVEVNPAFCRMHGYAYEELIGCDPTMFIHPDDHGQFAAFLEAFKRGGEFRTLARDVRKDGSTFEVEVHAEVFEFRGRPHLLGIVRDISDAAESARELAQQVEQRTREMAALVEVAQRVAGAEDLPSFVRHALTRIRELIDCDGVYLYLERKGAATLEDGEGPPTAPRITTGDWPEVLAAVRAGECLHLYEDEISERRDQARALGLQPEGAGVIVAPLRAENITIGFLAMHKVCDRSHEAPRVAELAQALASEIAIAVMSVRHADAARAAAALDERNRIARDLHDAVSQTLFSTTMHARAAEMALDRSGLPEGDPAREHVASLASLTLGALAEMRALIFELRPGAMAEAGLAVAIRRHASALTVRHELAVEIVAQEERLPLTPWVEEDLYRLTQEALGNVVKHAQASQATVELWSSESCVTLRIRDDGRGFDPSLERPGHLGLRTMSERAERIGGSCDIRSAEGEGTTIVVRVPVSGNANQRGGAA